MTNFSKYFYEVVKDKSCVDIVHPGKSCAQAILDAFPFLLGGVIKFYLPILLIPQLTKFEWSKEFLVKIGKLSLQAVVGGVVPTIITLSSFCGLFGYLKKHYYQFFIIPLILGSISSATGLPSSFVNVLASGGAHHFIDYIVSKGTVLNEFKSNPMLSTLLFMTLSSSIVYLFRTTRYRPYWLLHVPQPEKGGLASEMEMRTTNQNPGWFDFILPRKEKICKHKDSCELFLWKEIKKVATIGALFSLAKSLAVGFGQLRKARIMQMPGIIGRHVELSWLAFIVFYCGSFKFLNCLLNRLFNKDSIKNTIMAGYCSGFVYIFYPRFMLISFALIRVAQLLWLKHVKDYNGESEAVKKLGQMPMGSIVMCSTVTFLFYIRAMFPHMSSKYILWCVDRLSGKIAEPILANYYGMLMGVQ